MNLNTISLPVVWSSKRNTRLDFRLEKNGTRHVRIHRLGGSLK